MMPAPEMGPESEKNIEELEKLIGPTGIGLISRGECPRGATSPMACMLCPFGHMLECHYPKTCSEARCSHYLEQMGYE